MIGRYPHRVILQRLERVSDGAGGFLTNWYRYGATRARVEPVGGSRAIFAERVETNITHRIAMRYRGDVDISTDRVVFNGRTFRINEALNINERGRELVLLCEEGVAFAADSMDDAS